MSLEQKINNLETDLHIMGTLVLDSLVGAVRALEDKDTLKASEVMDKDDEIDDAYMKIDQDWFELMATEQPVASDLRLSTSILQASLHLERLGDLSVYLGKTTHEIHDLPIPESLHKIVVEMGDMVIDMASSALESLKNRDAELALSTARKDELINSLYNIFWINFEMHLSQYDYLHNSLVLKFYSQSYLYMMIRQSLYFLEEIHNIH